MDIVRKICKDLLLEASAEGRLTDLKQQYKDAGRQDMLDLIDEILNEKEV